MSIENPASPFSTDFEKSVEFFCGFAGKFRRRRDIKGLFPGICPQSFQSLSIFFRRTTCRATPPGVAAPARSSEGPGENFHVIARSEATWQSPGTSYRFRDFSRRFPRGCAPRNDRWEDRADSPRCMPQISPYCLPPQSAS